MRIFFFIAIFIFPLFSFCQIKPAKLVGTYYGHLPSRWSHEKDKTKPKVHHLGGEVKLILKKNKKCIYKTNVFTSNGTWEISADSVLTCTFKNKFGDDKTKEESVEIKTYRVDKHFTLHPVKTKTSKLYKR